MDQPFAFARCHSEAPPLRSAAPATASRTPTVASDPLALALPKAPPIPPVTQPAVRLVPSRDLRHAEPTPSRVFCSGFTPGKLAGSTPGAPWLRGHRR